MLYSLDFFFFCYEWHIRLFWLALLLCETCVVLFHVLTDGVAAALCGRVHGVDVLCAFGFTEDGAFGSTVIGLPLVFVFVCTDGVAAALCGILSRRRRALRLQIDRR